MDIEEILGFQPDLIFFVALALGTPLTLSSVGHDVYDPVPLSLLSSEDQAKIRRRSSSQGGSLDSGQVNSKRDLWEKDTLRSSTKSQSMLILHKPRHSRSYFS